MKGITIQQYIDGDWVTLITVEGDFHATKEQIIESLENVKNLIFDADKVNIVTEKELVIFNRADGPIKVFWGEI